MDVPKLICAKCAANIAGQLYVVCSTCKQAYDLVCANIPEDTYHHRQKVTWVCGDCKAGKHPPISVSSRSEALDLESVPNPPCANNIRNTEGTHDIEVIRQIVLHETMDLLQERLAALISCTVTSQITPIMENSVGIINDRVALIEVKITSLESGQRRSVEHQNVNPANTYTSTRECPSPSCIPPVYEEEVFESGTIISFREPEIDRDDSFGGIRIIVRDELTNIMDQNVTNIISLAVVDQIAPIIQISIGDIDGRITAIEDKIKLLENSRRRNSKQNSSRADTGAAYPQSGFNSRANPGASNLQTGTSSRADPATSKSQIESKSRASVGSPSRSTTSSSPDSEEIQNRQKQKVPNDISTNTDDSLYVDDIRTIIRDELSNILTDRLEKTVSKAIAEEIAPTIEKSFGKLNERVATIEERINKLASTPRVSVDIENVPQVLKTALQAITDIHDGLDHLKNTSGISIDERKLNNSTRNSDNKDNGLRNLRSASGNKVNDSGEIKSSPRNSVDAEDNSGESIVDESNVSRETGVDEKNDSSESDAKEKKS